MPTSRALNKWLSAASAPTFLIDPDHAWRDHDHVATSIVDCDPQPLLEALPPLERVGWRDQWVAAGKRATAAIAATLVSTPLHEGHAGRALSSRLPDPGQVFLGSSIPIRAAEALLRQARPQQRCYREPGASGVG